MAHIEKSVFEAKIVELLPLLNYLSYKLLPHGSAEDREDLRNEAVLRILLKYKLFDPEVGSINGWVSSVMHNVMCDGYRKSR